MEKGSSTSFTLCPWRGIFALSAIAAMLLPSGGGFAANRIPLPRSRPFLPASPQPVTAGVPVKSPCAGRMASLAVVQQSPLIRGPGACAADDVVRLVAIWSPGAVRIGVSPPAVLRCGMAEALAQWVREASETVMHDSGGVMIGIETATSYDCRGQNRDPNAKLSQHGLANAVDVRALLFKNGKMITLTDTTVPMHVRTQLHVSACNRFTTVLGPGSDGYHEDHIHLDLAERRGGYRICQWDLLDAAQ